jgi:multiple sugar transport system substrate-binding protein
MNINVGIMSRALLLGAAVIAGSTSSRAEDLTVWSGFPEMQAFYEHVAAGLKSQFPDVTVRVEAIDLREHEKRIALGLTGGKAADLIELGQSTATRYLENELLAKAPADIAAFVKNPTNFNTSLTQSASYDDKVVGVPLFRGQTALFYNTAMFKAAGLSAPPATMAEYTAAAAKLAQRNAAGALTVSGWSMRLSGGGQGIAEKFWINMFQYGGNVLEPGAKGKWKAGYASEAGRQALKQYLENIYTSKSVTVEMPADADAFERGQTAMFIRESWVIGDIAAKAPKLEYATVPLPVGSIVAPINLYVSGKSKSKAAWAFAVAAASPENQLWLLDNVGWLPNRAGLDYSAIVKAKPALAAFVQYPANYKFFTLTTIGPIEEILSKVAAQLVKAFANPDLVKSDAAIDAFLKAAAAETNAVLKREDLLAE